MGTIPGTALYPVDISWRNDAEISQGRTGVGAQGKLVPLIRQQVRIQRRSDGRTVGLQGHTGKTRVAAVKCRVVNPSAQVFVMPQGTSYLQPKEPRIGVDEAWCNASVAAVPVDQ